MVVLQVYLALGVALAIMGFIEGSESFKEIHETNVLAYGHILAVVIALINIIAIIAAGPIAVVIGLIKRK